MEHLLSLPLRLKKEPFPVVRIHRHQDGGHIFIEKKPFMIHIIVHGCVEECRGNIDLGLEFPQQSPVDLL